MIKDLYIVNKGDLSEEGEYFFVNQYGYVYRMIKNDCSNELAKTYIEKINVSVIEDFSTIKTLRDKDYIERLERYSIENYYDVSYKILKGTPKNLTLINQIIPVYDNGVFIYAYIKSLTGGIYMVKDSKELTNICKEMKHKVGVFRIQKNTSRDYELREYYEMSLYERNIFTLSRKIIEV